MLTRRPSRAATSRSWLITISVVPARVQVEQHGQDRVARGGVQVAGRLVGQQQRRLPDHGPGDRHPLPLPAGQLVRPVPQPVGQADPLQRGPGPVAPLPLPEPAVEQPVGDVVQHPHPRSEVELLEDEADRLGPQRRQPAVGQPGHVHPEQFDRAAAGPVQGAEQVQHRRLARAGRPDHGHALAVLDPQRHPPQRVHPARVGLGHPVQQDRGPGEPVQDGRRGHPATPTVSPSSRPSPLTSTRPSANRPACTATVREVLPSTTSSP